MATRTVACSECGSAVTAGRYTCSDCGALLDGVSVRPRTWDGETVDGSPFSVSTAEARDGLAESAEDGHAGVATLVAEDMTAVALDEPSGNGHEPDGTELHEVVAPDPADDAIGFPDPDASEAGAGVAATPDAAAVDAERDRGWPPHGAIDPLPVPEPRVPAGAYLPPSAVLAPVDATMAASTTVGASGSTLGSRASAVSADVRARIAGFGSNDRTRAAARRTIAYGATIAILGFVLPWANLSLDAVLRNWLQLWGLAGAGHWLLVAALAALIIVTVASGRPESWPVGAPALALGGVLAGLIWPYLFGGFGRPLGVLVVLVGAIVLIAGGSIRLAARHEAATPPV